MSFHMQSAPARRASASSVSRVLCDARLSRGVRPVPTGGTTFDVAGGVDALSPELRTADRAPGDTEAHCGGRLSWCTFRQRNRRAQRHAVASRAGTECTGTPCEATEKRAEAITSWTPLDNVSVRSATRAHWDKAAVSECKQLGQLHSRKVQQRLNE